MSAGPLRRVIDEARAGNGLSLADLTVLAHSNDPYRHDNPGGHRNGAWVAEQFERIRRARIHLRGLHYAIVVRGNVLKPNGQVYLNDDADWHWLVATAAKAARWLGYVPFTAIVDERNAEPFIHRDQAVEPDTWVSVGVDIDIPDVDDLHPAAACDHFQGRQPFSLVIVGEKASMAEVVLPIAKQFHADLYLPTGEISDTLIHQIASDATEDGRPLRLFYLSDFDPTGFEMPANIGRKLQALRDLKFPKLSFECRSVALTFDQVRELGLPSTPLKDTERRSDRWRAAWGVEQTEIDALATLQPQLLRRIVTEALEPFYDHTLEERVRRAQRDWEAHAQIAVDEQIDQELLARLKHQATRELAQLQREFEALNRGIRLATEGTIELPEVVIPEPEIDPALHGMPIISSAWPWVEQTKALIARKAYDAEGQP